MALLYFVSSSMYPLRTFSLRAKCTIQFQKKRFHYLNWNKFMKEEKGFVRCTYLYFLHYCFKVMSMVPLIFEKFYLLTIKWQFKIMNNNSNAVIENDGFQSNKNISIKTVHVHRINRDWKHWTIWYQKHFTVVDKSCSLGTIKGYLSK